jgi:hypothetical protein
MTALKTLSLVLNAIVLTKSLPRKKPLPAVVVGWALVALVSFSFEQLLKILPDLTVIGSVLFIPLILWAYKGKLFLMTYAMLMPMFSTVAQQLLIESILRLIMPFDTDAYWLTYLIASLIVAVFYVYAVLRFGKRFFDKLFAHGRNSEWALYTFSSLLTFVALTALYGYLIDTNPLLFILALCTLAWSYVMLCFAIINTHQKSKQKYEADLARVIISTRHDYYNKLTVMTEQLRILRHGHKHHFESMKKTIKSDYNAEMQSYLSVLNEHTDEKAMDDYCTSREVNALLDSFSERCKKQGIEFKVKIILPPVETIDDYELCIIIGNLLENAITACLQTPEQKKRYIELSMRPCEYQYGIKVENSCDGVSQHEGKLLYSIKKDGIWGVKSIDVSSPEGVD